MYNNIIWALGWYWPLLRKIKERTLEAIAAAGETGYVIGNIVSGDKRGRRSLTECEIAGCF